MQQPIQIDFQHGRSQYRAVFDNCSDELDIHHVTTRAGRPFERRIWPSRSPIKGAEGILGAACLHFVDAVLDGGVDA